MDMSLWSCVTTLTTFVVMCLLITDVHGSAVMSIDISSEWMQVVTITPGVPLEKAIIKANIGKIMSTITFDNGERSFGDTALNFDIYSPSNCYVHFLDLLGKKIDNPVVELFKKRFPHYNIVPHPERNTVLFERNDSDGYFSPEELVVTLLEEAKKFAKYIAKGDVNEAVISIPGYFGQAERSAVLHAAEMAGIKVLQLINSNTAAALNYGKLNANSFHRTSPVYMMFLDMNTYGTQASIVSYQQVRSEDKTVTEFQPQLTVLGVSYERNLSSLEIQLRLRDFLASKFNSLRLTSNDVTKDPTSMAKLFIEAERLKEALIANTEHLSKVKNLIDDKDMEIKVTREELEELCTDLLDNVIFTAKKALETCGLTMERIEQVILVGTGIEVHQIQDRLVKDLRFEQSLNIEGPVVMGAAYKAAELSYGFEVKPFIIKDATLFPIQITFDEKIIDDNKLTKQVKQILFGHMDPYPQHKIITLNKHRQYFDFTVGYAELNHLDENEVRSLGSLSLVNFKLNGVQDAYSKYQGQKRVDTKGIEVDFLMDDSGLLVLHSVNLIVEKSVTADTNTTVSVSDSKKNLKLVTVKEAIDVKKEYLFVTPIQGDELQSSVNKMTKLKEIDEIKSGQRESLHTLIEYIYEAHSNLNKPEFASAITDKEKTLIVDKSIEISNWLGRNGSDAKAEVLYSKYDELKKLVTPIQVRVLEHSERPLRLKALNNTLDSSNLLLKEIKMAILDDAPFTQAEINTFEELITQITKWINDQVEEQEKLPKNVDPVLSVRMIEVIHSSLEDELSKFTSWKLKIKKPKAKASEFQIDDKEAKTPEEQNNNNIVETKASQDDEVDEFDDYEEIVTIEDDEDSENQLKNEDLKYFKPIEPTNTGKKKDNEHTEL